MALLDLQQMETPSDLGYLAASGVSIDCSSASYFNCNN